MKSHENRSTILEYIFRNAPVARATIAEATEITPATVTANVSELISENIVSDSGELEPTNEIVPGRKRILININPNHSYSMGIEFTDKNITLCITNLRGTILDEIVVPAKEQGNANITDFLIEKINWLLDHNPNIHNKLIGIGIAVPGHMDDNQENLYCNACIRPDFNCTKIRESILYPIICENNIRAMAYGEYLFHPERTPDTFALFHVGLGMFCAVIRDGTLFHGNSHFAGEIGHTIVNLDGKRCECGKYGCLQTYSSEKWLIKSARFLHEGNSKTILKSLVDDPNKITIHDITAAHSLGDSMVSSYISEAIKCLGVTISNIAIILNPGKIQLHGELFCNKDIFHELMDFIERQLLFADNSPGNSIDIIEYSPLNGAIGASAYCIKNFFINKE